MTLEFGPCCRVVAVPRAQCAEQCVRFAVGGFGGDGRRCSVERAGGFSFNMSGVSNRFITPNGDHRNDNVVFTFDNPRDSAVNAEIVDMHGRLVVGSLPAGPVSNSLMWDGTAGGRPVPGGVYIYQISAEGQKYSGTVVIIK